MSNRKRTRAQTQEEKKTIALTVDDLYTVFGYNNDLIYIPLKGSTLFTQGGILQATTMTTFLGLKRDHYIVYSQFNKLSIYRTEKPTSERKAIPFLSIIFATDEKKISVPLSQCMIAATYFDGQKFICRADQLILTTEPGEKTFMFKDCFFHEEYSRSTYMCLKKGKKIPEPNVHAIERTDSDYRDDNHNLMYT